MSTQHCTQCGAALESQAHFCRSCGGQVHSTKVKKLPQRQRRRKRIQSIPLLALAGGGLLLLVGTLFFLLRRPAPMTNIPNTVASIPDNHDESGLPYPEVARISLEQTKANFEQGTAVIVDVRTGEEYAKSHIMGAVSMPLNELEARFGELSKEDEIITYCS